MSSPSSSVFPSGLPLDGSTSKLKGLPFKATIEDVLAFFGDFQLTPESIFLKRHPDGRPNGEVRYQQIDSVDGVCEYARPREMSWTQFGPPNELFVISLSYLTRRHSLCLKTQAKRGEPAQRTGRFSASLSSLLSLAKVMYHARSLYITGEKFGDRYVRVYPTLDSDMADMQAAVMQQSTQPQGSGSASYAHTDSVVKIKSLPFDASQLDVLHFFEGFKMKANGVQLVVRSDNKPTGEAFVDFESPEEATMAIREKDHKVFSEKFGDRYVRLIQVSRKEMQATLALRFGGEGILKMKGIPFKATANDVRKFFVGYRIKMDGISFIMHADGRPTGMAFIEFDTPQEAVRAMEKDRAKFGPEYGDRFCMLQLVGRHEMDKVVLNKESDALAANKLLAGNMDVLRAAAIASATQAALNNPWLSASALQQFQLGLLPHGGLNGGASLLDPNQLAALTSQLAGMGVAGGIPGLNGLTSLLPSTKLSGAQLLAPNGQVTGPLMAEGTWPPGGQVDPLCNPLMFFPNTPLQQDWARGADPR